jgi:primosomal protein N' (replication factor Y)
MRYYFIYVAEVRYQKPEPLTYAHNSELAVGTLVLVPYGNKHVVGFVDSETIQPDFKTKEIYKVFDFGVLPSQLRQLHSWMCRYYPGNYGALTQLFVPSGINVTPRKKDVLKKVKHIELPDLTAEQHKVITEIKQSKATTFLLHGETGSGKTRVYQELIAGVLDAGLSVLLLAPEISLIPQIEASIKNSASAPVISMHSGLTKATRTRHWMHINSSDTPVIVIGTRSALFAPIKNLGLVIVDEMHEPAYKQESVPRYYALRAAAKLAQLHKCRIIYGSATPPIVEYFMAEQTKIPILRMSQTARPSEKIKSTIIDMKNTKFFARHRAFSDPLLDAIGARLAAREQTLLFLNRRGTARQVLCQACGWQAACPRCDIPLTYHGDDHTVRCHTCGYKGVPPYTCPTCASDNIIYRSLGTKALVEALHDLFPEALIKRFDTDNLVSEKLDKHFDAIHGGEVDILVGTQMLGKGLDLPKLSLVGIVNADTSLGMPDFSSSERSYQLLHQAIGRVGRGHRNGEVIVQSFNPESPLLQAALRQNWQHMYDAELAERRQFGFPPFYFLLKISVSRKSLQGAEKFIGNLYTKSQSAKLKLEINQPTPSFYEKTNGKHNWQMVIKAKERSQLTKLLEVLPKGDWTYDLDPINLL